jgi:polysaccharide biosynthesis protein PslG
MRAGARKTLLGAALLWCAFELAHVSEADAAPFQFGACVHLALGRSNATAVVSALRQAGFDSFRDDVFWGPMETQRGVLQFPQSFGELDRAVSAMRQAGGRPVLILDYGNKFYDNGGLVVTDEALDAFERYVRYVVRHFGNRVDQYEVWNEWNTGFGSNPKQSTGDPVAYYRLLKRVYQAVKSENPHAAVIGGAVAGTDLRWSKALFQAGGLNYLDAFSVHSYTLFHLHSNPEVAIRILDLLRQAMRDSSPQREIPVFVTEMGWPTNIGNLGVSEDQAAGYLVRFLALVSARPWIAGVWWYDLIDDGQSDSDAEQRFGLLHTGLTPKPAYGAASRMAPLLKSSKDVHSYRLSAGGYAVTGKSDALEWLIAWKLEPAVQGWAEGIAEASDAGKQFDWTATDLPDNGSPVFWHKAQGKWAMNP